MIYKNHLPLVSHGKMERIMGRELDTEERNLVDQAVAEGRVQRIEPKGRARPRKPEPADQASVAPVAYRQTDSDGPAGPPPREIQHMGVREALEWAFGVEHARIDANPVGALGGHAGPSFGMEFVMMQRAMLGGTKIDESRGRSTPADDAEMIADAVQSVLDLHAAIQVADYARAGRTPDAMIGAVPRCVPVKWKRNQNGMHGQPQELERQTYVSNGRVRRFTPTYVPVEYEPSWRQIAAARRHYLEWWGWMLKISSFLSRVPLTYIAITPRMPAMEPWKNSS